MWLAECNRMDVSMSFLAFMSCHQIANCVVNRVDDDRNLSDPQCSTKSTSLCDDVTVKGVAQ